MITRNSRGQAAGNHKSKSKGMWNTIFPPTPLTAENVHELRKFIFNNVDNSSLEDRLIDEQIKTTPNPLPLKALALFNAAQGASPILLAFINIFNHAHLPIKVSVPITFALWAIGTTVSYPADLYKIDRRLASRFKLAYSIFYDMKENQHLEPNVLYFDLKQSSFSKANSTLAYYSHDPESEADSAPVLKYLDNLPAETLIKIATGKLYDLNQQDCTHLVNSAKSNQDYPVREPDQEMQYGEALDPTLFSELALAIAVPSFFGGFVLGLTIAATLDLTGLATAISIGVMFGLMNTAKSTPVEMMLAISSAMQTRNEKKRRELIQIEADKINQATIAIDQLKSQLIESLSANTAELATQIRAQQDLQKTAEKKIQALDMGEKTDYLLAPITGQPYFNIIFNSTFLTLFSDWFPGVLSLVTTVGLKEALESFGTPPTLASALCLILFPQITSALHTFITFPMKQMLESLPSLGVDVSEHSCRVHKEMLHPSQWPSALYGFLKAPISSDIAKIRSSFSQMLTAEKATDKLYAGLVIPQVLAESTLAILCLAPVTVAAGIILLGEKFIQLIDQAIAAVAKDSTHQYIRSLFFGFIAELATGQYCAVKGPLNYFSPEAINNFQVAVLAIANAALVSLAIETQIICAEPHCYDDGNGVLAASIASESYLDNSYDKNPIPITASYYTLLSLLLFATAMVAISAKENILARINEIKDVEAKSTKTDETFEDDVDTENPMVRSNSKTSRSNSFIEDTRHVADNGLLTTVGMHQAALGPESVKVNGHQLNAKH